MDNKNDKPQSTYKTPAGMASLFGEVNQVKSTMLENMEMLHERGDKLQQLDNTAQDMLGNAQSLANSSAKKKK